MSIVTWYNETMSEIYVQTAERYSPEQAKLIDSAHYLLGHPEADRLSLNYSPQASGKERVKQFFGALLGPKPNDGSKLSGLQKSGASVEITNLHLRTIYDTGERINLRYVASQESSDKPFTKKLTLIKTKLVRSPIASSEDSDSSEHPISQTELLEPITDPAVVAVLQAEIDDAITRLL